MRNQPGQLVILIENHPVRSRRATIIRVTPRQDRELVVGRADREVNVLVVVVLVRVVAVADGLVALVVRVASLLGGVGVAAKVAVAAAGVGAGAGFGGGGEGEGGLDEEEGGEGEELPS